MKVQHEIPFEEPEFLLTLLKVLSEMIPITVRGADGKFVFTSEAFLRRLHLTQEDVDGKGSTDLIRENLYGVSSSEVAFETEKDATAFFPAGGREWVYSESKIIRDQDNKIKYVVTTCTTPDEILREIDTLQGKMDRFKFENKLLHDFLIEPNNPPVFYSPEMEKLLSTAIRVAPTDASILITGESGVGKDIISKIIHNNSLRKSKPFVPICIPQMPPALLESELFGYEKGAFTGAKATGKAGLLEVANGGTVFLDEIGDVPLDLQVKLLRVIENRELTRVGGHSVVKLDVRFLAATNKDLRQMVKEGKFREDLLFRLNVINLRIKPLRERKDDIIPLANHFLSLLNRNYEKYHRFSEEVYSMFINYSWPGNVRELRNIVEKLVILSEQKLITPETVQAILDGEDFAQEYARIREKKSTLEAKATRQPSIGDEYKELERQRILNALIQTNGNRKKAAELLNISRSTLYRWLEKEDEE